MTTPTRSFVEGAAALAGALSALLAATLVLLTLAGAPAAAAGTSVGRLLAPAGLCPHQTQAEAPTIVQLRAMRCLTEYARRHANLERLSAARPLARAANRKGADILRCDEFSHEACGREFTYWPRRFGYIKGDCWAAAENIAWGAGPIGSARAIFRAWLHSPGHRENILGPYADLGVGLHVGSLEGHASAHIWVQEFGSHAC